MITRDATFMPSRSYIFPDRKPQVDHIFPIGLVDQDDTYREAVDILWNFQPMPAEVNRQKSNRHPKEFFKSSDGKMYWASYDFIPEAESDVWNDHLAFVHDRKNKMLAALKNLYGVTLVASTLTTDTEKEMVTTVQFTTA